MRPVWSEPSVRSSGMLACARRPRHFDRLGRFVHRDHPLSSSMIDLAPAIAELTRDLVALDSRSFVTNIAVAERIERELQGFEVERIDYQDAAGVAKRVLVA